MHPQTVWDAVELTRLRSVRATTHAALANNLKAYLDRHNNAPVAGSDVMGFAMMTRIWGDRPQDKAQAVQSLMNHCNATWSTDKDLGQARDILNGAVGYDVLYDLLTPAQRTTCKNKIGSSAKALADAADAGEWWTRDLVQNHNWVNFAAIGVAGQALEGENANASHWRDIARINFQKVKVVQDLVIDGSWHEGIGYMEFGLMRSLAYWLGAVRGGSADDKTNMLSKVGRYILYTQVPNHPRVHVMTHGDWNWSRPGLVAVLRWAARRFQDPYAQEAARRWDLEPRLTRAEFGLAYALEYVAYDPNVPFPNMAATPLDLYNEDEQSVIMRSSWVYGSQPPASDAVVVGFKAGVFGGRGNYERMRNCNHPGGILNYGHDHEDDLGLWIYGKGGWLLPEAVGYSCCLDDRFCCGNPDDYHSTSWHNTFMFDGVGQLGDRKSRSGSQRESGIACGSNRPSWFFNREASMPLHVSTDHYAFARGDGKSLYPASLGINTLLRTIGLSRENGGFIALQDRVLIAASRKIEQLFHSMNPNATNNNAPWLRLTNLNDSVLGVRVVSPASYVANITTQVSNNYQENMDDDGRFGCVKVSPPGTQSNVVFLEVLWPTKAANWNSRPNVQPLDANRPHRGFSIVLGTGLSASTEYWIYNTSGGVTEAGDLRIEGSNAGDIGIKRTAATGAMQRLVVQGSGRLLDQGGRRTLLDLGTNTGVLEVAFTGPRADLSGTAGVIGVSFYGPGVSQVTYRGRVVQWSQSGDMITVTAV